MAVDYNILRSKMLSLLPGARQFSLPAIELVFKDQGTELNENDLITVEQIIHEFYFEGIVVPGVKPEPNATYQNPMLVFPCYHLTEYGKKVLRTTEYQLHDPDGYLARIRADIPKVDDVIIRYLEESLSCFRKNLLLAAAVMLGCAAEKAVLLLVQAFGDSLTGEEKAKYEKETKSFVISQKWKALWKRLEPLSGTLPGPLGDDLGTTLEPVYYVIRVTRNEAGHPTGKMVEKETVHANLLLFPIFCKRIYGLMQYFSLKSSSPTAAGQ